MGANLWRDVSPQYFHVPKLGISEGDDLFLVFTSLWAKSWTSADVSMLLNHPPNIKKWRKWSILRNHLPQCLT